MTLDIVTKGLPCQFLSLRKSSTWNFPPYGDTDICLAWEFAL